MDHEQQQIDMNNLDDGMLMWLYHSMDDAPKDVRDDYNEYLRSQE